MNDKKNPLGNRMKRYEEVSNTKLTRKIPVIIRLDGCAFHTFTKGFDKPFDEILMRSMQLTMLYLCKNIQGCVFGYTQSDEITLCLVDYKTLDTDCWFDYKIEKMCSICSSMASRMFNEYFKQEVVKAGVPENSIYYKKFNMADFDCRVFNVPKEDVNNCLIWRQKDAEKNSIQSLAQSLYSHKELNRVSTKDLQNKMFSEKNINWNDLPTAKKRGTSCIKNENNSWGIDYDMPILTQNKDYLNNLIFIGE